MLSDMAAQYDFKQLAGYDLMTVQKSLAGHSECSYLEDAVEPVIALICGVILKSRDNGGYESGVNGAQ